MELYVFIIVVLFGMAISDLMVGVSNDAVNFLNSAIGSNVAPRWIIMIIASLGIMAGVTFSSGMMEVARKGIFHPENFIMTELLIIFLAVMITDVILLDLYNTFGLPTSTTVSIVFELLGAAVAVSLIKIHQSGEGAEALVNYINTAKALAIITGILVSIVIAFSVGAIVQFITRLIFTFDFEQKLKRYGAIWGGVALTAITYFILIKGAKGASFLSAETLAWIKTHTLIILGGSFVVWALIFQVLLLFTRVNILKIIVLAGTFALAMAFAANDLVNFIGVPLAGLHSFTIAGQTTDPLHASMEALAGKVKTDTWMLLIAGLIMVVTLWLSKKAQTVTKTELGLARQEEGEERFESTGLARVIIRMVISLSSSLQKLVPKSLQTFVDGRFARVPKKKVDKNSANWDLLRASVNLMVASMLISIGTSLKLPLSTTYVTFMVAMGSSLSDRSWGRDSAVYRISGVLTVVGGWFLTAIIASTVAMIFATLIYFLRLPAVIGLVLLAGYFVLSTFIFHKKREQEETDEDIQLDMLDSPPYQEFTKFLSKLEKYINRIKNNIDQVYVGISTQNRKKLKDSKSVSKKICKSSNKLTTRLINILQMPDAEEAVDLDPRIISALNESCWQMREMSGLCYTHVENQHSELTKEQKQNLSDLNSKISVFLTESVKMVDGKDILNDVVLDHGRTICQDIKLLHKDYFKQLKHGDFRTRQSLLYLAILTHTEAIIRQTVQLISGISDTVKINNN